MKLKKVYRLLFIAFLFCCSFIRAQTISPMYVSCVIVDGAGDVSLKFIPAVTTGTASFTSLTIYYSNTRNGAYTNFVPINSTIEAFLVANGATVTIPTPDANAQAYYFYTELTYTANGTPGLISTSDTVSSIFLQYTSLNDGFSNLNWNAIRSPLLPSSSSYYQVKRSFQKYNLPISPSTSLSDSTASLSYVDTLVGKCDDKVFYTIEIADNLTGCKSVSNIVANDFSTPGPLPPVLKTATKNVNNLSVVTWFPSTSSFTQGYTIYKLRCSGPDSITSLFGINNISYTDYDIVNGCSPCYDFRVASYLGCPSYLSAPNNVGYVKIGQPSLFHNSIQMSHTFNQCTYDAVLTWCGYKNWNSGVQTYNLWVSKNGAPASLVASIDPNTTTYTYIAGKEIATYVFQIEAKDNSGNYTSISNLDTLFAAVPVQPKEVFLKYVSVLPNGFVEGNFTNDTLASVHNYEIFRAETAEGPFDDKVAIVDFNLHKDTLKFIDTTALVYEQSYYYKVQTIDSCLNLSTVSNIAKTVFLQANSELNFSSEMSWNNYEGWTSGVNYYEVYRSYTNRFEETLIAKQLLDSGQTYIDDLSDSLNPSGYYCYRVMAVSVLDTIHYEVDSSYSNFVCIREVPHIFVPNAFTPPDGYNPIFKPTMIFIPNESYELKIFDRWGTLLATINDVDKGWDGSYKGEQSQMGVYGWQIRYKNMKNEFKYLKGTVSLVR